MLPTLVIFFRESLEASLVVGILLAYLRRVERPDQARAVWLGVAAGLAVAVGVALVAYRLLTAYAGSRLQLVLEGVTYLMAAGLLTYMSFWMKEQGQGLRRELEARVQTALGRGSTAALVLLAAVTVGREGLETVLFTLAIALGARPAALGAGAALGLLAGLLCSGWLHLLGRRLPLGAFFRVLGILLLLFAAGLLVDGVQNLQALGWLPVAQRVVWHSARLLREHSVLGDLLHSFFGYADRPTLLQVGVYGAFVLTAIPAFLRRGPRGADRLRRVA